MRWRSFLVVIVSQVCLITTACAGLLGPEVIAVDTSGKPAAIDGVSGAQAVTLRLGRYTDSRRDAGTRKLGSINATVSDIYGTQMVLGQDVVDAVTAVLRNHFAAGGFEV